MRKKGSLTKIVEHRHGCFVSIEGEAVEALDAPLLEKHPSRKLHACPLQGWPQQPLVSLQDNVLTPPNNLSLRITCQMASIVSCDRHGALIIAHVLRPYGGCVGPYLIGLKLIRH